MVRWMLLVCLLFVTQVCSGQESGTAGTREVEILRADVLEGGLEGIERVQRLQGDVQLRQDSTLLRADRVVRFLDRNEILFLGSVEMIDQGDTLRADTVRYDRSTKEGRALGNVRLSDGEVLALAPSGRYFVEAKRATFDAGVTLIDSLNTLRSLAGTYWTEEKRAEFAGEVQLDGNRTHLEADSVTYLREEEVSVARGNVFIERWGGDQVEADSTTRTFLLGEYAYNDDRAGLSRVEGHPLLMQLRQDSTGGEVDTLLLRAARLESIDGDTLRRLVAVDSVAIWQRDFAARADSLVHEQGRRDSPNGRDATRLYQTPLAWFDEAQVSGDTLRVVGEGGEADSLFVRGNAFVAQRDTMTNLINQIRGRHLTGTFEADSVRIFVVGPAAEAIYHMRDDEDRPDGGVRTSGDEIVFSVRGDTPQKIAVTGAPQGTYYAEDQLPQPFRLDSFRWDPALRPLKTAFLDDPRWHTQRDKLEQNVLSPSLEETVVGTAQRE